jgi:hypothetical protein
LPPLGLYGPPIRTPAGSNRWAAPPRCAERWYRMVARRYRALIDSEVGIVFRGSSPAIVAFEKRGCVGYRRGRGLAPPHTLSKRSTCRRRPASCQRLTGWSSDLARCRPRPGSCPAATVSFWTFTRKPGFLLSDSCNVPPCLLPRPRHTHHRRVFRSGRPWLACLTTSTSPPVGQPPHHRDPSLSCAVSDDASAT